MLSNRKNSRLSRIFPFGFLSCGSFRVHAKERDITMDEQRETKDPSSSNSSSIADQIKHTDKRTPIEASDLSDGSEDAQSTGDCVAADEQDEAKSRTTSFSPVISRDFSQKWMAFKRDDSDMMSMYKRSFSLRSGLSFTELSEANVTEKIARDNQNDVLSRLQHAFVVSDATKPDCPIMFASNRFLVLTGYTSEEVIGRNCRFLQGPETDKNEVAKIKDAIRMGNNYCGKVLNYKKSGTPFWNLLTIGPVKDCHGSIIKFVGMQVEISKNTEEKEKAIESITEVLMVNTLRSHLQSKRQDTDRKHEQQDRVIPDYALPKPVVDENLSILNNQSSDVGLLTDITHLNPLDCSSRKLGLSGLVSSTGLKERLLSSTVEHEGNMAVKIRDLKTKDIEGSSSQSHVQRERGIRRGIDLGSTLERIEEQFVITNPRLHDNPVVFASDRFLESTEYTRGEVLGRNFWFLQGPETDQATVLKIKDAIREHIEITVQIINYTKSGKKFWNLFHLQPMWDQKGELQYFIGMYLHVESSGNQLSDSTKHQSALLVKAIAENVEKAIRDCELPDASLKPEDLWAIYCQPVLPRPHKKCSSSWIALEMITSHGQRIGLQHFAPVKPLGFGDIGSVHLVELKGTGKLFAMKAIDKTSILKRNKVRRACLEREVISLLDHPFLPTLYSSFETPTHVCLITDFCPGGALFDLLDKQPMKMFNEEAARFYAAEVVIALEYLHCLGIIYRDLKPENILIQEDGHIVLTDFDLSFRTSQVQSIEYSPPKKTRRSRSKLPPVFVAEPIAQLNSFVGTEEYIAPEIIMGAGHSSSIDWWTLAPHQHPLWSTPVNRRRSDDKIGILLYEMLYGRTPFKGKNRRKIFSNILFKDVTFPFSIPVSLAGKQLIDALLQRNPARRLGSRTGAVEIKQHPFFQGINWPKIRCMRPPSLAVDLQVMERDSKTNEDVELSHSTNAEIF